MNDRQKLILATRKYLGISQAKMAEIFGLSQSKIARAEKGSSPIWDHEWSKFIKKVNASENSIISDCSNLNNLYKKIHLVDTQTFNPSIKMRSIRSLNFIVREELGKDIQLKKIIDRYSLIKDFEQIDDMKINPQYLNQYALEVLEQTIPAGLDFFQVKSTFSNAGLGEDVFYHFLNYRRPIDKVKYALSLDNKYYDFVFYSYKELKKRLIVDLSYSVSRADKIYYICDYHRHYLLACSSWGLDHCYANIKKVSCYFDGDSSCQYIMDFEK